MRYGAGLGLLAVIFMIAPSVVAQEGKPSPDPKTSEKGKSSEERGPRDRPGGGFPRDEGPPADFGAFQFEGDQGPLDEPDEGMDEQIDPVMGYIVSLGTLALAIAVVIAAAVMRVRRVMSSDATFKLIGLSLTVIAGLSLLRSGYAQDLIAPMTALLGTALGFIFGKQMGSTVPEAASSETPPIVTPPTSG